LLNGYFYTDFGFSSNLENRDYEIALAFEAVYAPVIGALRLSAVWASDRPNCENPAVVGLTKSAFADPGAILKSPTDLAGARRFLLPEAVDGIVLLIVLTLYYFILSFAGKTDGMSVLHGGSYSLA